MRASKTLIALASSALLLGALPASSDQADGRYDLPDHALAASDDVGSKLFDRDKHMVLRPKHETRLEPEVKTPPNQLPAWPAKWAPQAEDEY